MTEQPRLPRDGLSTRHLTLREFTADDADDLVAAMADPLVRRFLPQVRQPFGAADAADWIDTGSPAWWAAGGACLAITYRSQRRLAGAVLLTPANLRGVAEMVFWLAPWARGHGLATEAAGAVASRAFEHGVRRLELSLALDNVKAQRVAVRAGFRREGIKRGAGAAADGGRFDQVLWARLASDPPGPTPRLLPDLPGGELSDGVVTLLPLGPDDVDDVYTVRRMPEVVAATVPPEPPDREQVVERCSVAGADWLAGASAALTIRDAPTDRLAGEISLYYHEPPTLCGMIGYHLDPAWRGRGFATRAVRLLCGWAFAEAGLARLEAGTAPENTASQAVLARAGFRRIGLLRSRLPGVHGHRIDDVLHELIPESLT